MPISTLGFQENASQQMQALETAISQTQTELSTGLQLQNAADNPAAMAQVTQLNAQISASQQYQTNGSSLSSNLQIEEQSLSDATSTMQSARDLAVEANNASLTATQRQDISTQLQQLLQQMVSTANSTDSNGNYLFSGETPTTQPFSQSGSQVTYNGSASVSQVQISSNQLISSGDAGANVFMNIPGGNGTFTTAVGANNSGGATIDSGTVVNSSQWVPDTYTITFTDPTDYTVTNSEGATVSSGTYSSPGAITFNGISTTVSGTPAAGDTFTVAPAGTVSAFATISNLIATLNNPALSSAQISTQVGTALEQMDAAVSNFSNVSASVGARLNAITAANTTATASQTAMTASVSSLQNVDYAAATTQLSTQELALQAAQESYASIAKMSLFNYLQ
ncbi:MAG TPA: flagellar hook-associated protein FlgL [Steroidobacteraceae bacterium]|jgi:flagellar hook-associated protein 3 FlgL|nr:flagellar hook-associated protein FlgL [Steroidobacteraceae bacterium]